MPRSPHTGGQHNFAMVPSVQIQRSSFDRSHGLKTTFDFGDLIPIFVDEALPGDTFSLRMNTFGRMATMVHPIMENMWMDFFFFAVPNRLLWVNWQKFMGEQTNPGDPSGSPTYLVPQIAAPGAAGFPENSIYDYFGIPTKVVSSPQSTMPSALPFRAYTLVWNEWFRDENLQNSASIAFTDGPDTSTAYQIQKRGKRHDYFTSALPQPQKGTAVSLPLVGAAPVVPNTILTPPGLGRPWFATVAGAASGTPSATTGPLGGGPVSGTHTTLVAESTAHMGAGTDLFWGAQTGLATDLSLATAVTVNQLREAIATQRMLERDARGGTRYTEIIRSHFGVVSPDARLQRPEYLGGGTVRINVNPVAATSAGTFAVTGPPAQTINWGVGTMGAFGTTSAGGIGFTKSFTEHCVVIGLVAARADLNYQQGLDRMWSRRNRFDFYWPEFANLGEQPVKNKEIFWTASSVAVTGVDEQTFGFQERYAEYRYKPSKVTGRMRSNATGSLQSWHLAQNFSSLPALNSSFIVEDPDVDRVLVVATGEPQLMLDVAFQFRCARPMPIFSVPGLRRL